ncbi:hypothetical protein L208DRAFT_1497757 [Tricholoma matsutake]|nr:hypothetical protein L208DRAFT_1497757 [Tricholoma matsutake 945]
MDYIFLSSITGILLLYLIVSYDIACQWYKNFWTHLKEMPTRLQFVQTSTIWYKVPKFHLPPHTVACHGPFDGEGVERYWSWLNGTVGSTSQMGPGARHDTLDDFMGFSNFRKTNDLGLCKEHGQKLVEWEKMVREWEDDHAKPSPYDLPDTCECSLLLLVQSLSDH